MLFYRFVVASDPLATSTLAPDVREAFVLLRMNSDATTSTERAVTYLQELGWMIREVIHAQQADSVEEFVGDEMLLQLYRDAAETGIACRFEKHRPSARLAAAARAEQM